MSQNKMVHDQKSDRTNELKKGELSVCKNLVEYLRRKVNVKTGKQKRRSDNLKDFFILIN